VIQIAFCSNPTDPFGDQVYHAPRVTRKLKWMEDRLKELAEIFPAGSSATSLRLNNRNFHHNIAYQKENRSMATAWSSNGPGDSGHTELKRNCYISSIVMTTITRRVTGGW
jgi:hypothetical protein